MFFEEPLLNQQSQNGACGVDFAPLPTPPNRTGQAVRKVVGLPQVSEPQVVRHFTRLSQHNFAIDTNLYPLGSCTMKHNPRLNEKLARLSGLAHIHPLQPAETVQGAANLMAELKEWLKELTGLADVCLSPAAGAHGELTGMLTIKAAHAANGAQRTVVLIPDSAHGTNPATAAMCGYTPVTIPSTPQGLVDMQAFNAAMAEHGAQVAAFMLTNPNTCGLFEPNIKTIAESLHQIGAFLYCDGANFNAIMGQSKPADMGVDVMQFNLHKTFSTPHGGGGPGCGPIAVSSRLQPFIPAGFADTQIPQRAGRIKAFHGHFGMMVRALAYMKAMGGNGLKQAAEDAVLNANYLLHHLKDNFFVPFEGFCMHECLLTDKKQKETSGATTHDIAKGLLDEGFHPMTVYFPLVVQGAMLIEPTESESKATLDAFIAAMKSLAKADAETLHHAPQRQPRQRLDEVTAARQPKLTWAELS